jgi:hypothetical protein
VEETERKMKERIKAKTINELKICRRGKFMQTRCANNDASRQEDKKFFLGGGPVFEHAFGPLKIYVDC